MRQVAWACLVAAYALSEATGAAAAAAVPLQEGNEDLQERLAALEDLVSTQGQTLRELEESLRRESDRRLTVETLLQGTVHELTNELLLMESSLKVDHDRLVALESTLQEEIKLREEAEISGKKVLLDMSKKIAVMEGDLTVVSLLDSRLRSLEEEGQIQIGDISNIHQELQKTRRVVDQTKREVRRQRTTLTTLAASDTDVAQVTQDLWSKFDQLTSWCLALNESTGDHGKLLLEAHNRTVVLNTSLGDVHTILSNLTGVVTNLQRAKEDNPLVLCPLPYRKVGKDCFYLLEERMSWDEARKACIEQGVAVGGKGDLAEPSVISNFRHYVDHLQTDSKYLWVGGWREGGGHGWWWVSGRSLREVPVPWDLSEPDNAPDQHHLCVHSTASIKFHDCTRKALLGAICQVS
ncbi:uncharacterized protein [Panulirus ornatus]|uniref:uncharacterized protein isoform X2 n=1 Tax=Panulirus ornatus TaxID=150431 RepID=UPI003A85EAAA